MHRYYFDIGDFRELYDSMDMGSMSCSEFIQSIGFPSCEYDAVIAQWYMTDESEFLLFRLQYG